eukprot:2009617-Pyramimonas_sp.AAC.2
MPWALERLKDLVLTRFLGAVGISARERQGESPLTVTARPRSSRWRAVRRAGPGGTAPLGAATRCSWLWDRASGATWHSWRSTRRDF